MNKLLILFILTFSVIAKGQSVDAYVISSSGDALMSENGALYFTVGEPFNTEISDGSIMVAQGFLQITIQENSTLTSEILEEVCKVYPNPAHDYITIEKIKEDNDYKLVLISSTGQKISASKMESPVTNLKVSTLDSGVYFLQVHSDEEWIGSFQIVKQ